MGDTSEEAASLSVETLRRAQKLLAERLIPNTLSEKTIELIYSMLKEPEKHKVKVETTKEAAARMRVIWERK